MNEQYILNDEGTPVKEPDPMAWIRWMQNGNRKVDRTKTKEAEVSTVFLGLNYSKDDSEPLIWESVVFGGKLNQYMNRCGGDREAAKEMHKKLVEYVKKGETKESQLQQNKPK